MSSIGDPPMKAVIFDLFGTLTDPAMEIQRQVVVKETGYELGVSPEEFWTCWKGSFHQRITGHYSSTAEMLRALSAQCGVLVGDEVLHEALGAFLVRFASLSMPRTGALEVLDEVRARGFRLALMSDCSSEIAETWSDGPYASRFDVAILSWREGLRKPDSRLYAAAASRLGVSPEQCWYVGDGGGREHTGARAAGMTPILVTNIRAPGAAALRADADEYLPHFQVDDVDGLLDVVGHPS